MLRSPDLLARLDAAMELCGLVGERGNGRAAYLAAVSRKLAKPLAVIVQSTSAAGKTTLMDAVLSFFPEEERIKYSAMTGQSLYYLGDASLRERRKDLLALWRDAQRLIRPLGVVNPFAHLLTFTAGRTRTRRDHEKYLTLIDSIALLHQHRRELKTREVNGRTVEFIEVSLEDIATANALAPEILGRSLDELPPQTRRLLNHLRELIRARIEETNEPQSRLLFSRREVCERSGWTYAQVRTHLERLIEAELVAPRGGRNGALMLYELLIDAHAPETLWQIGLIDVEKLRKTHAYDPNLDGKSALLEPPCEPLLSTSKALNGSALEATLRPCANAHPEPPPSSIIS